MAQKIVIVLCGILVLFLSIFYIPHHSGIKYKGRAIKQEYYWAPIWEAWLRSPLKKDHFVRIDFQRWTLEMLGIVIVGGIAFILFRKKDVP